MTCYIYRRSRKYKTLIGPFKSGNEALAHREKLKTRLSGGRGRPASVGSVVPYSEAVKIAVLAPSLVRLTPEQDLAEFKKPPVAVSYVFVEV